METHARLELEAQFIRKDTIRHQFYLKKTYNKAATITMVNWLGLRLAWVSLVRVKQWKKRTNTCLQTAKEQLEQLFKRNTKFKNWVINQYKKISGDTTRKKE